MRFKPGQEVVCTKKDNWSGPVDAPEGPKYNEVVTVHAYRPYGEFVILNEYRDGGADDDNYAYHEKHFEPVITTEELNEALADVPETISI